MIDLPFQFRCEIPDAVFVLGDVVALVSLVDLCRVRRCHVDLSLGVRLLMVAVPGMMSPLE